MRHPQGSGSVGMPFFISLYVVSFLLLKKKKSIDNHQIINAFLYVGMTGIQRVKPKRICVFFKILKTNLKGLF